MTEPENRKYNAGVLIVASNRDDRRVLFDSFDGADFDAIYTARDVPQAHALLAQDPELALIFVEFVDPYAEAEGLCRVLAGHPRWRLVPRIGVVPAGALPPGTTGGPNAPVAVWIKSPVSAADALRHARELIAPVLPSAGADGSWIDNLDVPALLVDPRADRVRSVNPRAIKLLRRNAEELAGASVRELLGELPSARAENLGLGEARIDAHGDPRLVGLAVIGCDGDNSRLVLLTAGAQADSPLETLAGLARTGLDIQGVQPVLKRVIADYGLDFFYVCVERGGTEAEPQVLAAFPRSAQGAVHPVWQTELYRRVLAGAEFSAAESAAASLGEAFFKQLRLNSVLAVPLYGDGQRALGALMAGSRKPQPRAAELLSVLRLVGSHLALQALVARYRSDSRFQGLHDSLTRLPNRLLFNDRLQSAIAEAGRSGEQFAVLFVDLDRFKTINDSLGHATGDQVLSSVAKRLRASVRASDTVSRYAGDEFTLILRHIVQRDDVMRVADKIVKVLETPLTLTDGRELQITASLGISFYPDDGKDGETLLKHADVAMYNAKGMGRNTYQVYVAVPEESNRQRLDLESKLRMAERNNELRSYYQPQVDAITEDIIGMEALIRWEHPELGLISPGFFIPIAEDTGLRPDRADRRMDPAPGVQRRQTLARHVQVPAAGQRQPVGAAIAPDQSGRSRRKGLARLRFARRRARPGGHREHQHQGHPEPDGRAWPVARTRLPHRDRRLRHWPVLARLHQALSVRSHQDRPDLRAQHRRRPGRRGDRARDHQHGAQHGPRGGRRGRRNRGPPALPARVRLPGTAGLSVLAAAAGGDL